MKVDPDPSTHKQAPTVMVFGLMQQKWRDPSRFWALGVFTDPAAWWSRPHRPGWPAPAPAPGRTPPRWGCPGCHRSPPPASRTPQPAEAAPRPQRPPGAPLPASFSRRTAAYWRSSRRTRRTKCREGEEGPGQRGGGRRRRCKSRTREKECPVQFPLWWTSDTRSPCHC